MTETEVDKIKVSRRVALPLISILVIANILIRYPTTPHQIGWDSYLIHSFAGAISDSGYAVWILSPLSYFGMYPLSYPSGIPFLISSFSQVSGLSIEGTIWIYTILLGILAALGSFMFAGLFKKNFWFQYSVALLFSTSMGLLLFTRWTISARGTLVVLTPLFLWAFIKAQKELETKFVVITIMMLYVMASAHRMFVLVIPFILLYLVTGLLFKIKMKVKTGTRPSKHNRFRNISAAMFLLVAIALLISPFFGGFGDIYSRFVRWRDISEMTIFAAGIFARNLGPLALFSLLGIILLVKKTGKDRYEIFILGCAAIISPMMLIGRYISTFSLLFFMLLAGYGLLLLYRHNTKREKLRFILISTLLVLSFALSGYSQFYEFNILSQERTVDQRYLEIEGYDAAMWVMQNDVGTMTGSPQVLERISAISGVPKFPGKIVTNLIYGYAEPEDIYIHTRSIFDIRFYIDSPVIDRERTDATIIWRGGVLSRSSIYSSTAQGLILRYNVETLVVNNYEPTHSVFAESVMQTSYCTFHNQKLKAYSILIP